MDPSNVRRLGDPLYTLRPWLTGLVIFLLLAGCAFALLASEKQMPELFVQAGALWLTASFFIVVLVLAVPRQRTDVFYLRSFKKDASSFHIRELLEVALGQGFRLSGIRDPRKRIPNWLKPLALVPMAFLYAGARYLSLEAGRDWKLRLWHSLCEARGAVIDLRDLTEFVHEEVALVLATLPACRVMLITGPEHSQSGFMDATGEPLQAKYPELNWVLWDAQSPDNQANFMAQCLQFVNGIKGHMVPRARGGAELLAGHGLSVGEARRERLGKITQYLLGVGLLIVLSFASQAPEGFRVMALVLSLLMMVSQVGLLGAALVGKLRRRRMAKQFNSEYQKVLGRELAQVVGLAGGVAMVGFVSIAIALMSVVNAYEERGSQVVFVMQFRLLETVCNEEYEASVSDGAAPKIVDASSLSAFISDDLMQQAKVVGNGLTFGSKSATIRLISPQTSQSAAKLGLSWAGVDVYPECDPSTLAVLASSHGGSSPLLSLCGRR